MHGMCLVTLTGDTFMGFKNETALKVDLFGQDLWVCLHGTKESARPRGLPHEQHLLLCTQVPQEPCAMAVHAVGRTLIPLSRCPWRAPT